MSYDLGAYQEAIRAGHAFAWDLKWEAASRQYRIALSERPGDPAATLSLARALERMGDLDAAREMYEEAHRLLPDHAPVLVSLIELQRRQGDLPSAATSYVELAAIYLDQGQANRAAEMARRLDELAPPDRAAVRHLAEIAERVGHADILADARRLLATLPPGDVAPVDGPTPRLDSVSSPPDAPDVVLEAPPADFQSNQPEPVQILITALAMRERAGRPRDDELSRLASDWCPLPAELLKVAATERASLAMTMYEAAEDLSSGRLDAAFDACWGAVGVAADYLPAQIQLARVDATAGKSATAEWRLRSVADLYEAQEQFRQAAETWAELGAIILGPDAVVAPIVNLLIRQDASLEALAVLKDSASRCLVEGRVADAASYLEQALTISPGAVDLGLWRARLLVELGRADDAMAWIDQALEQAAKGPAAVDRRLIVARAILATRAGRATDVESVFDEWDEDPRDDGLAVLTEAAAWGALQGEDAGAWYLAGQILAATNAIEDADRCYRRALAIEGAPVATIRYALGRLAAEQGDWPGAARWLIACLDGLSSPAAFARGDQLLRFVLHVAEHLQDNPLRVRAVSELVTLHPEDPDLRPQMAECLWSIGDVRGAREQLQRLADLYWAGNEPVRALAAERAASSMHPPEPASQSRLAERCFQLGLRDEGIAALEAVVNLEAMTGATALSSKALGALIEQTLLTEPRRAHSYRERLARVSPTDGDARRSLARAYLQSADARRAVAELWDLGRACGGEGRWSDAAAALQEALRLDPWDSRLIADAARALSRAGEQSAATDLVERLRRREPDNPEIRRLDAELQVPGDDR